MPPPLLATPVPGGQLRYRCWGAGSRDVVLLHGLLGSSAQWSAFAARAEAGHRLWALELPGIAASTRPRDLSLHGMTAWLEQACAALPLSPSFSLLGSSWGGALALDFAARSSFASRLQKLVLAAPAHPFWRPTGAQRFMLTPWAARVGAWLGAHASAGIHRALLERIYGDPARLPPDAVPDYAATLRQPHLGAAIAGCARHFRRDREALRAALPALRAPVLLVWGDRDPVVPLACAAPLRAVLPQADLKLFPGVGHLPFVEVPDAFAAAVLPFLR